MYDAELNRLLSELRKLEKKTEQNKEISSSPELDLLNKLDAKSIKNKDKDLTLAEYLGKYKKIETEIDTVKQERKSKSNYNDLMKLLERDNENTLEKKIDEDFEYREVKTVFSKKETGREEVRTKDIFINKSKERCNNVELRIKPYANTKSTLTNERKMSPLNLQQFLS